MFSEKKKRRQCNKVNGAGSKKRRKKKKKKRRKGPLKENVQTSVVYLVLVSGFGVACVRVSSLRLFVTEIQREREGERSVEFFDYFFWCLLQRQKWDLWICNNQKFNNNAHKIRKVIKEIGNGWFGW